MKLSILLSLLLLVACDSGSSSEPYLQRIDNLNKLWTVKTITGKVNFQAVDLTNPSNVSVIQLEKDGVFSDCVYNSTFSEYNTYYGSFIFDSLVSGDPEICDQLNAIHYAASFDTRTSTERVSMGGAQVI